MFRYGKPTFSDGLNGMSLCVGTSFGHRYVGILTVRAAWGLGRSRSSSSGGGGRPSGRIVGDVRGVDPEGVTVQFLPVTEGYRTETAAQMFPRRGSGIVLGEDLLHDGASPQISPRTVMGSRFVG